MTKIMLGTVFVFGLMATLAFAQQMPGLATANGIASGLQTIAKAVGIILCIVCGLSLASGGPGAIVKVSGLVLGLFLAFAASPIINWLSPLG